MPSQLAVLAIALVTVLHFAQPAVAQPDEAREITIRGFQFDPRELAGAERDDLEMLGIDPDGLGLVQADDVPHWRILQFARPLDRDLRRRLRAEGLRLDMHIGGAYIEKVSLAKVDMLLQAQLLRASTFYFPEFKLAPHLQGPQFSLDRNFVTEERRQVEGLLLRATAFPDADLEALAMEIRRIGALDVLQRDNRDIGGPARLQFRLDMDSVDVENALMEISRLQQIKSIEEVGEAVPLNSTAATFNQSGNNTDATLWQQGLTGAGQVISIFDVGVADIEHCMLTDPDTPDNLPGPAHRKVLAIRDVPVGSNYGQTHPTFVAASAAGDHYDESGGHAQRGGAWSARLILVDIDNFANASSPANALYTELNAVAEHAHVHSNSWHDNVFTGYTNFAQDFDDYAYKNEDQLFVAAAGTGLKSTEKWGAPAITKNALTVSALNPVTSQVCDVYGSYPSAGRYKPDVTAVGVEFQSAVVASGDDCKLENKSCATSFATPHAAAMASLAREYFVNGWHTGKSIQPSGALIKATLINSAMDISSIAGFPNEFEGWGAITLDRTLLFGSRVNDLWTDDVRNSHTGALDGSEWKQYTINVTGQEQPLKVTLVWYDPPLHDDSDALSNDLDLEVQAPNDGPVYLGNVFDPATLESMSGGTPDNVNNVEQVLIGSPDVGEWNVWVRAADIGAVYDGFNGQGYALVVTASQAGKSPKSLVIFILIVLGFLTLVAIVLPWRRRLSQPQHLQSASGRIP